MLTIGNMPKLTRIDQNWLNFRYLFEEDGFKVTLESNK